MNWRAVSFRLPYQDCFASSGESRTALVDRLETRTLPGKTIASRPNNRMPAKPPLRLSSGLHDTVAQSDHCDLRCLY